MYAWKQINLATKFVVKASAMRREISIPVLISLPTIIIIIIIVIVSTSVHHRREHRGEHTGCSTSCGLVSIRPPMRLKGDPYYCGDSKHELTCDDSNKTILELPFGEYYVKNISYDNFTMKVVDANLACDCCRPPYRFPSDFRSIYFEDPDLRDYYEDNSGIFQHSYNTSYYLPGSVSAGFVSFMNCSKKIPTANDSYMYNNVSCMSGNNTYVYASYGYEFSVGDLLPSCGFLSMVPIDRGCEISWWPSSFLQLQRCIQRGFSMTWWVGQPSLKRCFITASREVKYLQYREVNGTRRIPRVLSPFYFGEELIYCLTYSRHHNRALFFIVCWDTVISLLVIAILARLVLAPLSIYVFLAHEYWKIMVPINSIERFLQNQGTLAPTRYAYTDIIAMTNNFKEKLGQGGFGSVFKGELLGGRLLVAVKLLGNSKCNGEDFINEVATIGRIHHHHVVRLLGFCADGTKNALVYEFMPNGSLDKYIFSSNGAHRHFTMEKLNEIALGIARGIDYLHRGCEMSILHFDIKPHNVLLDQNFEPKIADFGLAKLYSKDYSLVSVSAARGTIGYIAPELVSRSFGVISHKSDVYSFGMLLMEMAGGRRNVDNNAKNSSQVYYPSWIYDQLKQSEQPEIGISVTIDDMEKKLCKIGLWCIQMRPSNRPSMSKVIEMLEAEVDTLEMAPKPFVTAPAPVSARQSYIDSYMSESSIISEDD